MHNRSQMSYEEKCDELQKRTADFFDLGIEKAHEKNFDIAISFFNKAISLSNLIEHKQSSDNFFSQELASYYYNRGNAYHQLDRLDEALTDYHTAIRFDPHLDSSYLQLAKIHFANNQFDKAIPLYTFFLQKVLGAVNNLNFELIASAYLERGRALYRSNKFSDALSDFDESLNLLPNQQEAHFYRGMVYLNCANGIRELYDKAVADFSMTITLNRHHSQAYTYRGITYRELSQLNQAFEDLQKALSLNPYDIVAQEQLSLMGVSAIKMAAAKKMDAPKIGRPSQIGFYSNKKPQENSANTGNKHQPPIEPIFKGKGLR